MLFANFGKEPPFFEVFLDSARIDSSGALDCRPLLQYLRQAPNGCKLCPQERAEKTDARKIGCTGGVVNQVPGQGPRQKRRRRVFQIHPLQIPLSMKHRKGADATDGRASMVLDDGVSHVPAAVSAQSGAVRQVDVFVRGEEIFIEPAELLEHLPRDQTCRT